MRCRAAGSDSSAASVSPVSNRRSWRGSMPAIGGSVHGQRPTVPDPAARSSWRRMSRGEWDSRCVQIKACRKHAVARAPGRDGSGRTACQPGAVRHYVAAPPESMLEAHLERRHQMFRTIVLAVDGSKHSEKAVELAKRLAKATNDEVVVTHVTELLPARF